MAEAVDTEDRFGDLSALLWLVTAGDQTAFRRLYEREATRLYTVALRLTGSAQLAAEAVHATLTAIWRNTVRFDPQGNSPEGWLLGLLRGRAIDIMRRRQRDGLGLEVSARQIDPEADLARLAQSPYAGWSGTGGICW
jgi:DNA-directed RNA polymerase specialized sigma24 family protein